MHATLFPGITIRTRLLPGDIGRIVLMHGTIYAREYGWDHTFEAYVAGPLAEFATRDARREGIWISEEGSAWAGSAAIVDASRDEAQLRWLLVHPDYRGRGIGCALLELAIAFSKSRGYRSIMLWTEARLEAAARLYESHGFRLTREERHQLWGGVVTEQRYDLRLVP